MFMPAPSWRSQNRSGHFFVVSEEPEGFLPKSLALLGPAFPPEGSKSASWSLQTA